MIVEMGSFQFTVLAINLEKMEISLNALNTLTNESNILMISLSSSTGRNTFSFGRKSTNEFNFDDQHLSGIHARIHLLNAQFILEDMSSTNG